MSLPRKLRSSDSATRSHGVPSVVVYDACVLHPAPLRDLLLRLARLGIYRAKWSNEILDECFRSILRARSDLAPAKLERTRQLMCDAVSDCLVEGYAHLIPGIRLPDANDRHVLAAAVHCGADTILTSNLRHFPAVVLKDYGVTAGHPDDFLVALFKASPANVFDTLSEQAMSLRHPPMTREALLDRLRDPGVVRFVDAIRRSC